MTTVTIRKTKDNTYKGFYCMGHAEYAKKYKEDILCSAISAITLGTINCLEDLAGENLFIDSRESDGFVKCDFLDDLQEKSVFLVEAMIFNLQTLSKQYGKKYLQVKFEEV